MPNYEEMYLMLFRATEVAINTLMDAQRACEKRYINALQTELVILELPEAEKCEDNTNAKR